MTGLGEKEGWSQQQTNPTGQRCFWSSGEVAWLAWCWCLFPFLKAEGREGALGNVGVSPSPQGAVPKQRGFPSVTAQVWDNAALYVPLFLPAAGGNGLSLSNKSYFTADFFFLCVCVINIYLALSALFKSLCNNSVRSAPLPSSNSWMSTKYS